MLETVDYTEFYAETSEGQDLLARNGPNAVHEGKGRLLLVEDEPLSQKYCQVLLQGRGYTLDIAANGKAALEYIAAHTYQTILMDVGLPDASGIDVARVIRTTDNPNREVPIIAFTAHLDPAKHQACSDAGMTAFLIKPVSPTELCDMLAQVAVLVAR
jgi:CheY-like chemotaxis protein